MSAPANSPLRKSAPPGKDENRKAGDNRQADGVGNTVTAQISDRGDDGQAEERDEQKDLERKE